MKTGRVRIKRFLDKTLKCSQCGEILVIQRKPAKNRGAGHIKHMYCPRCYTITAFEEQPI